MQSKDNTVERNRAVWKDALERSGLPREAYRAVRRESAVSIPAADKEITKCVGGKDQMVDSNPFRTKGAAQEDPEEKSNDPWDQTDKRQDKSSL